MSLSIRAMVVRICLPSRWNLDHQAAALALKRFSDVEADSAWQYLNAMRHTNDPDIKRMLFKNFIEETGHSDMFLSVASRLSKDRFASIRQGRLPLVSKPEDMDMFLAFAHESERSISKQFSTYARAVPFEDGRRVFLDIAEDEVGHEKDARSRLDEIVASPRRASWLIFRVKVKRALEAWERFGHQIGAVGSTVVFGSLYLLFGLAFHRHCRAMLNDNARTAPSEPPATTTELVVPGSDDDSRDATRRVVRSSTRSEHGEARAI